MRTLEMVFHKLNHFAPDHLPMSENGNMLSAFNRK
jgi:hypothetical protein